MDPDDEPQEGALRAPDKPDDERVTEAGPDEGELDSPEDELD